MHEDERAVAEPKARKPLPAEAAAGSPAQAPEVAAFLSAVGREVRKNRAKRGMTRRQLAQASETSERYLAQIESGAGNPSVSVLRAIAQALDLPAAALLPEQGARTTELGAILDLLAQVPEKELPALTRDIASRLSGCAVPASRRSGARWRSVWAGPSSSSIAAWKRTTAPAFPT